MSFIYAKIVGGVIVERRTVKNLIDPDSIRVVNGEPMLRLIRNVLDDISTIQRTVSEVPVEVIFPTEVVRTTVIRDMTSQEIETEDELLANLDFNNSRVVRAILFEINVIRPLLSPPLQKITKSDFIARIRSFQNA